MPAWSPPFEIPGCRLTAELHRGRSATVLRGQRLADNCPVVLKAVPASAAGVADALRLLHEWELLSSLSAPGIIRAYGLERLPSVTALVVEDFGAASLAACLAAARIDLPSFLRIALQLSAALSTVHGAGIIHKDINPSNVLINTETLQVKLADFGIASRISAENAESLNPASLEGTLPYIAPEQTGRMNRAVDYRADFYSLGVTLYEALIGWLPFQSTDPLELVHCHMARVPPPPASLNHDIPAALSDIVMKLLAKTPEERYQSAAGLHDDLETCFREMKDTGTIRSFAPGRTDVSSTFQIAGKLYGREQETRALLDAFGRVCAGGVELLLVSGEAGLGKSALIHEVQKPIVRQRGYFASGKFEQFSRDLPFGPLAQVFRELVFQLLAESGEEVAAWRQRLSEAVGPNGRVVCRAIPALALILGDQPEVQELPPAESQNRFDRAIVELVRAAAGSGPPLVLFLDDLQWADQTSLRLVQQLLSTPGMGRLLIIGSHRDVTAAHPLAVWIDDLRRAGVAMVPIRLGTLDRDGVELLTADTLRCPPADCRDLAALVTEKTGGNPYFVGEFLKTLHRDGLIRFDGAARRWTWDLAGVRGTGSTDNVVTLLTGNLQRLPEVTRECVMLAACLGSTFGLEMLARLRGGTLARTADDLWSAIEGGQILPVGEAYKFVHGLEDPAATGKYLAPEHFADVSYRFAHDRVQQAAYGMLPPGRAAAVHLDIGRRLRRGLETSQRDSLIFDAAGHLNQGAACIADDKERRDLIRLDLEAGLRSKTTGAFDAALRFLQAGLSLFRDDDWPSMRETGRDLLAHGGECQYLAGQFADAEKSFDAALKLEQEPAARGRIFQKKIELFIHTSRLDRALETGIVALRSLGVRLPARPGPLAVLKEMALVRLRVRGRDLMRLAALPPMTAAEPRVAMDILMSLFGIAYSLGRELTALVVAKMMSLTLRHGNADVSAYAYGIYGMIVREAFGAAEAGRALSLLSLTVSGKSGNRFLRGRCCFVTAALHQHWYHPARSKAELLEENYRCSMESGDLLYVSYAMSQQAMLAVATAAPLEAVFERASGYLEFVRSIHHEDIAFYFEIIRQFVRDLQGGGAPGAPLEHEGFVDEAFVRKLDATGFTAPRMYYRAVQLQLCCIHGEYDEGLRLLAESASLRHALTGQLVEAEFTFYHALTLAGALGRAPAGKESRHRRRTIAALRRRLQRRAALAPANFAHKVRLVMAEEAKIDGRAPEAMELYDQALAGARREGWLQDEALAGELAALFYLGKGREGAARGYLNGARAAYHAWGASGKVRELEQRHPDLLFDTPAESTAVRTMTVTGTRTETLDMVSVLKASQALAGEILLPGLLTTLMKIVMENAGAERGFLLTGDGEDLVVRADVDVLHLATPSLRSVPLGACPQLPETIIRAAARTRDTIVLRDASEDPRFAADRCVAERRPRSVLCMPVVHQGKLSAILYLENNLSANVFTPPRLEVLRLLSSQIGVSLENARLYERERELARMEEEVRLAASIQQELLPKADPALPGYEIAGRNIPARTVGGDYYDFIRMEDHRLAVVIGDVSGKGVPASLLMANLQATLRAQTQAFHSVAACMQRSNRLLYESSSAEKFATVFYGVLDMEAHTLAFSNCGHERPLLLRARGGKCELDAGGVALAMLEEFPFQEGSVSLEPGDLLVMFSDGVTEAMNAAGEQFGGARLETLLQAGRTLPLRDLIGTVVAAVRDHAAGAEQSDDITLVTLRRLPEFPSPRKTI